ncbi:hypothetical protein Hanom_Chr06g00556271 [Helianthus anomalus]
MFGVDVVLSLLLVVEDEATGATGWSVLVSFVDLLSAGSHNKVKNREFNQQTLYVFLVTLRTISINSEDLVFKI